MISVEGLTVRYGRHVVLAGLDLELEEGRVHGLTGRNGAGKTTLLDTLYGFVGADAGTVRFRGAPLRRGDVGYLPASVHFYPKLTGGEYLEVFRSARPGFDVEGWNELFGLPLDALVETYSLGMRKKLALLGVLSLERPFLVLDEPYNGLDLETNHILGRLLRELAGRGATVLVTSHVLGMLKDGCDAVHLLAGGRIPRSFGPGEYAEIEDHLLDEETARKLERVQALLTRS
jgi:ABC-2 type transport system ATP-binding protein